MKSQIHKHKQGNGGSSLQPERQVRGVFDLSRRSEVIDLRKVREERRSHAINLQKKRTQLPKKDTKPIPTPQPSQKTHGDPAPLPLLEQAELQEEFSQILISKHQLSQLRQLQAAEIEREAPSVLPDSISESAKYSLEQAEIDRLPSSWVRQDVAIAASEDSRGRSWSFAVSLSAPIAIVVLLVAVFVGQVMSGVRTLPEALASAGSLALDSVSRGAGSLQELDNEGAEQEFTAAAQSFADAKSAVKETGIAARIAVQASPLYVVSRGVDGVLSAGEEAATGAAALSRVAGAVASMNNSLAGTENNDPPTVQLAAHADDLTLARESFAEAENELGKVPRGLLPGDIRNSYDQVSLMLERGNALLGELEDQFPFLLDVLGHEQQKRYLVTFHNDNELRPAFGFMGSYAVVDLDQGRMSDIEVSDVYELSGQLQEDISPPEPLRRVSSRFALQDVNWWADFPTSARKIEEYFERSGGPSVDGIIALTPHMVEELLRATGPLEVPGFDRVVTAETFLESTQVEVEYEFDRSENAPKQFLGAVLTALLDRISQDPSLTPYILAAASSSLDQKYAAVWFSDRELQEVAESYGWTASQAMIDPGQDYFSLITANIGGGKTSRAIAQDIDHSVVIDEGGVVTREVRIKRSFIESSSIFDVVNHSWIQFTVPKDSALLSTAGFVKREEVPISGELQTLDDDVKQERENMTIEPGSGTSITSKGSFSAFGNWANIGPGESDELTMLYRLPIGADRSDDVYRYDLILQKQPGDETHSHSVTIQYPAWLRPVATYPNSFEHDTLQRLLRIQTPLVSDRVISVVFEAVR